MISLPFQEWFTSHNLVGGDWRFFWPENLKEILSYSFAWDSSLNTGIGKDNLSFLWLNSYLAYLSHFLTQILNISWNIAEKLLFFWPIVFISFFSAFFLSGMFLKDKFLNILSGLIYLTNTYALMIFSGGQVGVALSYAIAPFVFSRFIKLVDRLESNQNFQFSIFNFQLTLIAGLALALQALFDPRIAILSMIMVLIYFLTCCKRLTRKVFFVLIIPSVVASLLHMFWILPILISRINPVTTILSESASSSGLMRFFSFATLENTLSLLHPNWPENIFGKIGFMRPEFILIPILAFSPLLFVKNRKILFFAFLGLLGAYLAKGSNPPWGEIYVWLTDHVGLFAMYRDPTKWYIFVAIAYSILIPISLQFISKWISTKCRIPNFATVAFVIYFLFLLRPVFLGQVKGTFTQHTVPQEYNQLRVFVSEQPEFFRTLWIPKVQRFGYFSNNHPAISWEELFGQFALEDKEKFLQELGVKYIIIPFDSEGEIFLQDRKYNKEQYLTLVNKLKKMSFLKEIKAFNEIKVFQLDGNLDHFWIKSSNRDSSLTYIKNSSTEYNVSVKNVERGDVLVFAEGFSSNWIAVSKEQKLISMPFGDKINGFHLPSEGSYTLEISYLPAGWGRIGFYLSLGSLILMVSFLLASKSKASRNLSSTTFKKI